MLKQLVGRSKCVLGIHRRSRRQTIYDGSGHDTSVCRYCGAAMQNTARGWSILRH